MASFPSAPLSNTQTPIIINYAQVPPEGPKAVPLSFDFSISASQSVDYSNMQQRNFVTILQSIFIDNSANSSTFSITFAQSNQTIVAQPKTQGYYSILVPTPIKFVVASAGGVVVPVWLLNVPVMPDVWGAGTLVQIANPLPVTFTSPVNTIEVNEQLSLTASPQQLYILLHAIDTTTPTTPRYAQIQSSPGNASATMILVGKSTGSPHIMLEIPPGGSQFWTYTDITKLYVWGSTSGLNLNCEVQN